MDSQVGSTTLADMIQNLEEQTEALIIDLAKSEPIDSGGLKFLLDIEKACLSRHIKIVLQNSDPHLHRLLRIMKFDQIFTIENL